MEEQEVYLKGVRLTARYRYEKGSFGDNDTPPTNDYVELVKVFAGEVDIIDLLSADDEEVIESQIYSSKN